MALRQRVPERGGHATAFSGKGPVTSIRLTPDARRIADAECERTGLSLSDLVEALIRRFASKLGLVRRDDSG